MPLVRFLNEPLVEAETVYVSRPAASSKLRSQFSASRRAQTGLP